MKQRQEHDNALLETHYQYLSKNGECESDTSLALRRLLDHVKNLEQDLARLRNILPHTDRIGLRYESVCKEIEYLQQQRDTALKLADKWANRADKELGGEVHGEHEIRIDEDACCADELRAIYEPKEGK